MDPIYEQLRQQEQAKLNAAGFVDVAVKVGYFMVGGAPRVEVRLDGSPGRVAEAQKLLPFKENFA